MTKAERTERMLQRVYRYGISGALLYAAIAWEDPRAGIALAAGLIAYWWGYANGREDQKSGR